MQMASIPGNFYHAMHLVQQQLESTVLFPDDTRAAVDKNGDQMAAITGKRARGAEADECQTSVPGKLRCTCS